jgi:hypothetical protein
MKKIKVVVKEENIFVEETFFENQNQAFNWIMEELSDNYFEHYDDEDYPFEDVEDKYWGQTDENTFWIDVLSIKQEPIRITYEIIKI